jgi:O-antigen ligase
MGSYNLINFFLLTLIVSSVIKVKEQWFKLLNIWNYLIAGASVVSFIVFAINHLIKHTSIFTDRFYGFAGNPIFFAAILLIFFYINLYLFFEKIQTTNKSYLLNIFIALTYFAIIILTGSRGALLAIGVTGVVLFISLIINPCEDLNYLFKINVQRLILIVFTAIVLITSTIFLFKNTKFISNNYILKRLTTFQIAENSAFSRIIVSKIALTCFIQKPILGYGFDNFENCYQQNFDP